MPILTNSDYSREIHFSDRVSRAPVDLTGFALKMVISVNRGDAQPLLTLTAGTGLDVVDAPGGKAVMSLTAQQSSAIGAGDRVWAIYRIDSGHHLALATGKMIVREGV